MLSLCHVIHDYHEYLLSLAHPIPQLASGLQVMRSIWAKECRPRHLLDCIIGKIKNRRPEKALRFCRIDWYLQASGDRSASTQSMLVSSLHWIGADSSWGVTRCSLLIAVIDGVAFGGMRRNAYKTSPQAGHELPYCRSFFLGLSYHAAAAWPVTMRLRTPLLSAVLLLVLQVQLHQTQSWAQHSITTSWCLWSSTKLSDRSKVWEIAGIGWTSIHISGFRMWCIYRQWFSVSRTVEVQGRASTGLNHLVMHAEIQRWYCRQTISAASQVILFECHYNNLIPKLCFR